MNKMTLLLYIVVIVGLAGCNIQSQNSHILKGGSQIKLRNMQSRTFETSNRIIVLRNVIATLQDLGFVIDKADAELGVVSATKLSRHTIKMTVIVRKKSDKLTLVRASARYNINAIEDPKTYQNFYTSLEKSLFLSANAIE